MELSVAVAKVAVLLNEEYGAVPVTTDSCQNTRTNHQDAHHVGPMSVVLTNPGKGQSEPSLAWGYTKDSLYSLSL